MKHPGQIVLFPFPHTDFVQGKQRPALLLARVPGDYDDWLFCMISSQLRHCERGFDELVQETDDDFAESGLKVSSVIRVGRLAVAEGELIFGSIGQISSERLMRIKSRIGEWLIRD